MLKKVRQKHFWRLLSRWNIIEVFSQKRKTKSERGGFHNPTNSVGDFLEFYNSAGFCENVPGIFQTMLQVLLFLCLFMILISYYDYYNNIT